MDKAKITVKLAQRQPTPFVHHPISRTSQLSANETNHLRAQVTQANHEVLVSREHFPDQASVQPTERFYASYEKQGTVDVESPYLDEFFTWESDESHAVHLGTPYPRKSKLVWLKLFISASGAIVTGLLMGFLMMKLFQHETQEIVVHTTPIDYPAISYTLLQNGVFQSLDSARKAQLQLQNRGFPAALVSTDKHTVYIGFAMRQEDAQVLSQQLKAQQLDVFLKKIVVPACVKACTDPVRGNTWSTVMEQSNRVIKLLHDVSVSHLTSPTDKLLDAQSIQSLHQELTALRNTKSSLENELSRAEYVRVAPLLNPLEKAITSLLNANQSSTRLFIGAVQKDALEAIFAQKQLLESLP